MGIQRISKACVLLAAVLACTACSRAPQSATAPTVHEGAASSSGTGGSSHARADAGDQASASKFYVGVWEPISGSYQGMGNLRLTSSNGIHWHKCKTAFVEQPDPPKPGMLLVLSPDSTCVLDDEPHTRVLFVRVAKPEGKCDLNVSAYANEDDVRNDRPAAEGVYTRTACH
ncbi:hypothetical protein ACQV88_25655 [Ralstonia pseudosolanacearum]|uniref:hypothetical protein n=1 Tax=Ralstonia pseudosolanacearum TaxID=1310165 RepID=UPI003D2929DF